ncbi:VOC family protein [Jeongeupia wiesaeckerbachi]|uniref:VOC family protein n=1 Tax=Jeongeupia wiesaeckerbachi TaxID=3051218 RepID=UPI003D802EAA
MTIELDHFIVSCRDKAASAKVLGELLGVPWAETGLGPFAPVYINEGLTLDFFETGEDFPVEHYCFRVGPDEFNAILDRIKAAGIAYRSSVNGPVDRQIGAVYGNVYWNEPDGHQWELLTVSYARRGAQSG